VVEVRRIKDLGKITCELPELTLEGIRTEKVSIEDLPLPEILEMERCYFRYHELGDRECRLSAERVEKLINCLCEVKLNFGKFKGQRLCDVPEWYLEWIFSELGKRELAKLIKSVKKYNKESGDVCGCRLQG